MKAESQVEFPDPRDTAPDDPHGLLALGGDLSAETLFQAYSLGIFPWPVEGAPALPWFSPPERAILDFEDLRIPRSLQKFLKKTPFHVTFDRAFDWVIESCAAARRPGQPGTWITPEMVKAYQAFHRAGHAHSVEVWDEPPPPAPATPPRSRLAGGLYGVDVLGSFAGESMFHARPNASKAAVLALIERLRARGRAWIDIQQLTPHMEALGAKVVSRDDFLRRLSRTQASFRLNPAPF